MNTPSSYTTTIPISLFPIEHYNQNVDHIINPSEPDYDKPLVAHDYQLKRLEEYYNHLFSTEENALSPWSQRYIEEIYNQSSSLQTLETEIINWFNNADKDKNQMGYGMNFRPYSEGWISFIKKNMNLKQLSSLEYDSSNRAIAITNLEARALPTNDANFREFTLPGQGYSFDNLQMSSLWAGTPVYIVSQTNDTSWSFIIAPSFIGWIMTNGIARTNEDFIEKWQKAAKNNMAAIAKTKVSIVDQNNHFRFYGYIGSVFPVVRYDENHTDIFIPISNNTHFAAIEQATIHNDDITMMPLTATPRHFSRIMKALIGRPYGLGGLSFYNDCSQELKSLYTPFGIWLPSHSSAQSHIAHVIDKSNDTMEHRLNYLLEQGRPFMTMIYIGGHIFMYVGKYSDKNIESTPMTYQNVWGLSPANYERRAVIGKAVFLPLLTQYPEDPALYSLANRKYFQVAYLDQWPMHVKAKQHIDIKSQILPCDML